MLSKKLFAALLLCLGVSWGVPAAAQMPEHRHETTEQLGKVSFPISCASASQKSFERGVALLHSFGYEEAEQQFAELAKSDPDCAMAHWGIAMSLFHQIWERPPAAMLKRGHEEMGKAQKIAAKTERERGFISALAIFYSDPSSHDFPKQAAAYSEAMGQLYRQYPKDLEAGAFYALSLLAAEPPGDTSHAANKKAVAVLLPLFEQQPDHPGLAHYIIHSCDSPQMASMGLDAARRYAEIAPSSAHAVAYLCAPGALARRYPGEREVRCANAEIQRNVHAWPRTSRYALSDVCLSANRPRRISQGCARTSAEDFDGGAEKR